MSDEPEALAYRFKLRRASADRSGFCHTRWDKALPMTVLAATQDEAISKAEAASGEPDRGRYWTYITDSVEEVGS